MRLLRLACVLAAACNLAVARDASAKTCAPNHDVYGLIGERWGQLRASDGPLGCPLTPEMDHPEGRGRFQRFERGSIAWSPNQGDRMVVRGYLLDNVIAVEWGDTDPFNYDYFILRWDKDGKNVGQWDIKGGPRKWGGANIPLSGYGTYRIIVEGCDTRTLASSVCRQGWTNPVYVELKPPPPPTAAGCPNPKQIYGLIGEKWSAMGGKASPLGCPTTDELDHPEGKGRYQKFERGEMAWSPDTGPRSLQVIYTKGSDAVFEWGDTSPYNYDFFIVRWDKNGRNVGQKDVSPGSRTYGKWGLPLTETGVYRVIVKGCDRNMLGVAKCNQPWSNPVWVNYTTLGPAKPLRPVGPIVRKKLPVPAARTCGANPPDLYLKEWMRLGGPDGPMGCPVGSESKDPDGSGIVRFENGSITTTPKAWPNGVLAAYQEWDTILVDWTVSWGEPFPPSKFNYDKFIVKWDKDGRSSSVDILADMSADQLVMVKYKEDTHLRTKGTYRLKPAEKAYGTYAISVEGCDLPSNVNPLDTSTCRQSWMRNVEVDFRAPPVSKIKRPWIDLSSVEPATTVEQSKATLYDRAAAAMLFKACELLPWSHYRPIGDWVGIILAKMAYADYFETDYCPGRNVKNRDEAAESLLRQRVENKTGTSVEDKPGLYRTGEYDTVLTALIPIVYEYYKELPPNVADHVVNHLLSKSGRQDPGDLSVRGVPETENHILMIESARYLTNDLKKLRGGGSSFDNGGNGMTAWMLRHLQQFLVKDFVEYNSKPYQKYSMPPLQNLASYASDPRVRTAAQMVLDYVSAKVAVSSNDARRLVTFRRRVSHNGGDLLEDGLDPQTARILLLAGNTEILGEYVPGICKRCIGEGASWDMTFAAVSNYRIPDFILDLFVTRSRRSFYQGFHHYADELYAGSPAYLLSAGGHYASHAYTFAGLLGASDDIGLAVPTTLMPSGRFRRREELIRFQGSADNEKRSNMCVAPNFACGLTPVIPNGYGAGRRPACFLSVDAEGKRYAGTAHMLPWTFFNQSGDCATSPVGHYIAVYRKGNWGLLEALDTTRTPNVTFDAFVDGVLGRNPGPFDPKSSSTYVTTAGSKIRFSVDPDSRIDSIDGSSPMPSPPPLAFGTVLKSPRPGLVTIEHYRQKLELDYTDPMNPKRTLTNDYIPAKPSVAPKAADTYRQELQDLMIKQKSDAAMPRSDVPIEASRPAPTPLRAVPKYDLPLVR